jgi:murein L,D-transpeptidase YafK
MKPSTLLLMLAALAFGSVVLVMKHGVGESCSRCYLLPDLTTMFDFYQQSDTDYAAPPEASLWDGWMPEQRIQSVNQRVKPKLIEALQARGVHLGAPVFLRVMKEDRLLELWLKVGARWQLWRSYIIAAASGQLGPKLREGDGQVPEGFYRINAAQLNPASGYHLAMNLGYPNEYDRQRQRTGSYIMIHGRAVSVGCLAMTDLWMEEIYLLVSEAIAQGQAEVQVQIFPFRMTVARLNAARDHVWHEFWSSELWPAWCSFETSREPPEMRVQEGRYVLVSGF